MPGALMQQRGHSLVANDTIAHAAMAVNVGFKRMWTPGFAHAAWLVTTAMHGAHLHSGYCSSALITQDELEVHVVVASATTTWTLVSRHNNCACTAGHGWRALTIGIRLTLSYT